jgi:hypothetical protein
VTVLASNEEELPSTELDRETLLFPFRVYEKDPKSDLEISKAAGLLSLGSFKRPQRDRLIKTSFFSVS